MKRWDKPKRGVYYCCSTVKPGSDRRAKETRCELNAVWVDVDFKDVQETPDEIDRALRSLFLPRSIINNSGYGRHMLWLLKEALPATDEAIGRVEELLRVLAANLGGDRAVCQAAALLRLPFSHNSKHGGWAEVRALNQNSARYELSEIEDFAANALPLTLHHKAKPNGAGGPPGKPPSAGAGASRRST